MSVQFESYNVYVLGPPTPGNITRNDICSASSTISWDPFTSDPVCGSVVYDVTLIPSDGVTLMKVTDSFYILADLAPRTNYSFIVGGRNDAGVGESSVTVFYVPAGKHNSLLWCSRSTILNCSKMIKIVT